MEHIEAFSFILIRETTNFHSCRDKRYKRSCLPYIHFIYIGLAWGVVYLQQGAWSYLLIDKQTIPHA